MTPYYIVRALFYYILHIFFSDIDVIGEENVPAEGPVIFVGNHQNQFVDPIMLLTHNKREIGFIIAAKSLTKFLVGFFAKIMRSIPVRRPQDEARPGKGFLIGVEKLDGKLILKGKDTIFTQQVKPNESINCSALGDSSPMIISVLSDTELVIKFPFDKPFTASSYPFKIFPHLDQDALYQSVFSTLNDNGCIGIFPEGGSHDRVSLLPLKAGVTIMALGAMAANPDLNLKIVPCGLTYFSGHRFRSHVCMEYGTPISISPELVEKYKHDKKGACSELLNTITQRLKGVTINYPDQESMCIIQTAKRLYKPVGKELTSEEYLALTRRFVEGYIAMKDTPVLKDLTVDIKAYNAELDRFGIKDYQSGSLDMDTWHLAQRIIFMIAMLLLSLPGFILNAPIAGLAKYLGQKEAAKALKGSNVKVEGKDVIASYKIIVGFVLVPIVYVSYGLAVAWIYRSIFYGLVFLCVLPLFSYASIRMMEQEVLLYRTCIPVITNMMKTNVQEEFTKIKTMRKNLADKVRDIVEKYGPQFPFFKDRVVKEEDFEDSEMLQFMAPSLIPSRGFKK